MAHWNSIWKVQQIKLHCYLQERLSSLWRKPWLHLLVKWVYEMLRLHLYECKMNVAFGFKVE